MQFLKLFAGVVAALVCLIAGGCALFFVAAAFNNPGYGFDGYIALAAVICIAAGVAARFLLNRPDRPDNQA